MASPKPAVIVRREFLETPEIVSQQLRACIIGPSCQLIRYNVASEKGFGLAATIASQSVDSGAKALGQLLPAATLYPFQNIASTSQLDPTYVKVFMEDALVTYAYVTDSGSGYVVPAGGNNVAFSVSTDAWRTGNGATRISTIPQDVVVGDTVQLYSGTGSATLQHTSIVTGFGAAVVAASVAEVAGAGTADVTENIPATFSAGGLTFSLAEETTIETGGYLGSATRSQKDPRIVGKTSTVYTLNITAYDTAANTMTVSITTDTGLDNKTQSGVAANGVITTDGGLKFTAPAALTNLVVNSPGSVTVAAAHTKRVAGTSITRTSSATTYNGTDSTTYILACTKGGSILSGGVEFRGSTNNGVDAPFTFTLSSGTAPQVVTVGTRGVQVTFAGASAANYAQGFVKGDTYRVTVQAAGSGAINTLFFADPVPAGMPAITKVRLSKKKAVEIPQLKPGSTAANWTLSNPLDPVSRAVLLSEEVRLRDPAIASGQVDVAVTAGKLYVQSRAFQALPRSVGSVNTQSDITTQLGTIHPDNPLAYGVYKAFQNANGATVHYIATVSQTLSGTRGFADALALAKGNRNCYSLVPLTTDPAIWAATNAQVNEESLATVGRFRVMWIAPEINSHFPIQKLDPNGSIMFATSGTPSGGLVQLDAVDAQGNAANPQFAINLKVGDWVRTNFSFDATGVETFNEYRITSILDNNSIQISGGLNFQSMVNERIEIFRDLTSAELAAQYVAIAGGFNSERVFAVVPDRGVNGLQVDGVAVKNYFIACAFAGLRSGSRPQQPLSNVELLGFDGISKVDQLFNEADLDVLRDGGVWAVRNTDDSRVYVERQLSTSVVDIYRKEQSITCNVDSISFTLGDSLRNLVGRVNITAETTSLVEATIRQTLGTLAATNGAITVGPQLKAYTILSVTTPSTAQDTIVVKVSISLPLPMNVIDITLVI